MNNKVPPVAHWEVDLVLDEALKPEDVVLQQVRSNCRKLGMPNIEVSSQQGKMLELLVKIAKAKNVLEIGALGGYSTICLARGLSPGGNVVSLEYDPNNAKMASENLKMAGFENQAAVLLGDAHHLLPELEKYFGKFDFVFIDADKESNQAYFEWAEKLGTDDVTIVVDNVIRDGRVLSPERPEKLQFINFLASRKDFDCSVIQTVGSKGWDGFVLAKRKTSV